MSVGFIGRQDDLPTQSKLLQDALSAIKGSGRTAQSLRAGLYENAMRGGLAQNKMVQDQSQFEASQQLERDRLGQQNAQFGQELDMMRQALGVEALSGLRTGLATPRSVDTGVGATPSTRILRSGSSFSDTSGVYEDLDKVKPLERKNGGVIGNVKNDDGSDKVPVVAREGEYYINPETVAHIGGGDYKQGLRSLNALVREATGKEPGPSPVGKSGLRGFNKGGFVDDFGDVTLGNRKLPFAAQQAVSEAATSPLGKRVIANQFAAPQAEAVAQAAKQAQLQDISAQVREAAGRRTPIDELMNPKARGVQEPIRGDAAPKAGRVIGSAKRLARFAGPIGAVSGIATDVAPVANEHGVLSNEAATQLAETSAKAAGGGLGAMAGVKIGAGLGAMTGPFAPVAAPVLGLAGGAAGYYLGDKGVEKVIEGGRRLLGLNPDSPVEQMTPEQYALPLEPSRSQADEYSDSPERAAWLASLGNGQSTASQPDTADDFRTRNAAADVYRREWQRQSPGGLRNANPQALDTYNAEQQVRGTGISAQRQANGVMEFSGSGPAPKAQYLDANGNPTNEWQDTSQYRDAVVRSLGSNDPAMQQRGLAQAMQLQQRNQRGVSTGNPEMDQLLGQMEPREAAAVYRALNGGQGADGNGPKAPSLNDQRAVAGIVSGGNGDELMAGSINNRTAFADRAQRAGVNPEVVAGIANEPLSQDQLSRNVEIARVQNALVERANAPWTDAVEGGGLGAVLGVLGSLALRLAGNRVPGLKAAAEWAKANPTFLTRILAGAGAIGGTARGLDRQVTGDPKNMKWNEFQTTFRNGIPENAVKMDEKTGKVSILKDDGSAVSFDLEELQRQGLLADFANMITLGMVGGNKDFSENVRTLRGLSVAQPR